jgi:hypothetical protein
LSDTNYKEAMLYCNYEKAVNPSEFIIHLAISGIFFQALVEYFCVETDTQTERT